MRIDTDERSQSDEGDVNEGWYPDRVRTSTRGDSPDRPGRVRAHQRSRSVWEVNSTCANRYFRLRGDHWLQIKEHALRVSLSLTRSIMRSISSCGNPDMMVVAVQQALSSSRSRPDSDSVLGRHSRCPQVQRNRGRR